MVRARVSTKMKRQIEQLSERKGEAEAVLVREALTQYIERNYPTRKEAPAEQPEPEQQAPPEPPEEGGRGRLGFHPTNRLANHHKAGVKFLKR